MTEAILLPPGVAVGILAFLLSLLPTGMFIWLWYLRRHDRPVPANVIIWGFSLGALVTLPAFYLEKGAPILWSILSPSTVHYFDGAILPISSLSDLILPAVGTFLIVALVEEGLRGFVLYHLFQRNKSIDQIFDGLVVGIAAGLGFATVENTLYFFELFSRGSFDTLVFVFFLRFMVSTLAHISFGGIMGVFLARGLFSMYRSRFFYVQAFLIPWALHGLYDWLLGVNMSLYAVIILLAPLIILIIWSDRRDHFILNRSAQGKIIIQQKAPVTKQHQLLKKALGKSDSPWNRNAPWLRERSISATLKKLKNNA